MKKSDVNSTETKKLFYNYQDIMELVGCSKSKSYEVISECNKVLQKKGKMTFRGKVPVYFFNECIGLPN